MINATFPANNLFVASLRSESIDKLEFKFFVTKLLRVKKCPPNMAF
jgi:hypothetical protein